MGVVGLGGDGFAQRLGDRENQYHLGFLGLCGVDNCHSSCHRFA